MSRGSVQPANYLDSHDVAEFKGVRTGYPGKALLSGVRGAKLRQDGNGIERSSALLLLRIPPIAFGLRKLGFGCAAGLSLV